MGQSANLGGNVGENHEFENAPEELKKIWREREQIARKLAEKNE